MLIEVDKKAKNQSIFRSQLRNLIAKWRLFEKRVIRIKKREINDRNVVLINKDKSHKKISHVFYQIALFYVKTHHYRILSFSISTHI